MLDKALISEADRNYNFIENKKRKLKSLLSAKIKQRIHQTATCIEHDEHILKQLLGSFSYVLALPDKPNKEISREDVNDSKKEEILERRGTTFFDCVQVFINIGSGVDEKTRHLNKLKYTENNEEINQYKIHLKGEKTIKNNTEFSSSVP